jgi:hypothetical protein
MDALPEIPGATEVVAWFGGWPSFHDAEVLEVHLFRRGTSFLRLHTWVMTDQLDSKGYYVLDKHAVVTFALEGIDDLNLSGFSGQNVINELRLEKTARGFLLWLEDCYGLGGEIEAAKVSVDFSPGKPNE